MKPDIDTQVNSTKLIIVESKSSTSNTSIQVMDSPSRSIIELTLEDGFTTPDETAKELIKKMTETKYLYALKLLFENLQNRFSPQILRDTLVALADPTPFDYYAKQNVTRLELHLRTWTVVLERICFSPMHLSKELHDKIYNSLTKFADIYHETLQAIEGFVNNNFNFDQQNDNDSEKIVKNRNYNIEFLLTHLRDTLNSLRDDETWFQEIIRKTKELLKVVLNIVPGVLSATSENAVINDNCSIFSILTQLRQDLSFKYSVASYYIDWRIMLIIHYNLLNWTDSSEKIFNKKFGEMLLMEYIWGFLEREWDNVANKSILNSQNKFDELSTKLVKSFKNTGSFLSKPFALPHTLWFGILDLAQNLILKSTHTAIHGLGYYLAIESLNKAPSSFIQFKSIEILLHLYNINNQLFSMIEIDFDQYAQKLKENNLITDHFQNLLAFFKQIYSKDFNILYNSCEINNNKGKEKEKVNGLDQSNLKRDQLSSNPNILDVIAVEMTCPISSEPTDQLCILKCQHILSLNNFKKLKQKSCPKCRETIKDSDVRYISQNTIYKNLYSHLFEAGYILPSIEIEDLNKQHNSDTDNSEAELILTKKKKIIKAIKLNSNISLRSIFPKISKKQHPIYQNAIKELNVKNYEKAEYYCKKFLKAFPTNYTIKCILAYIYRCLNNYEQAHLYLKEAINLKEKKPIAYFIRGEIFFWQGEYEKAINNLNKSLVCKAKMSNLYIILGNSNLYKADSYNYDKNYLSEALKNYGVALYDNPNSYLCLKNSAYIYEKQKNYSVALKMLDRLLSINKDDSLVLCYYGKILSNMKKYYNAISYFTKANNIDPENVHNLNKRAVAFLAFREYDRSLLDLNKVIQLNPLNSIAYYNKVLMYITQLNYNIYSKNLSTNYYYIVKSMENITDTIARFEECLELDLDFWSHLRKINKIDNYNFNNLGIISKFNTYMYKDKQLKFIVILNNN
jgi:tetratricopeptide (TPR) repeat protein